jgi:hypothetical protein
MTCARIVFLASFASSLATNWKVVWNAGPGAPGSLNVGAGGAFNNGGEQYRFTSGIEDRGGKVGRISIILRLGFKMLELSIEKGVCSIGRTVSGNVGPAAAMSADRGSSHAIPASRNRALALIGYCWVTALARASSRRLLDASALGNPGSCLCLFRSWLMLGATVLRTGL